jgi:catechol 2,3-dioxygenase-like lactoylglutathione lyase family enzyme
MNINKLKSIDCVMYKVKDLKKSQIFYEKLGMKMRWEDAQHQMIGFTFPENDSEIVIHSNPDIPNFDICYAVENVEAMCKDFKENGYRVVLDPIDVRSGKYAIIEDLDGNKLSIIDLTTFNNIPQYDK